MEPQNIDKNSTIDIRVLDPQTDSSKGFYTYMVMGSDQLGTFQIRRRFNDFFYLREILKKKWPGLYIPPIPQKKMIGGKDQRQIQYRKRFFNYFLQQLGKIHHLFYSSITQQFLRNKAQDMEKLYSTIGVPKTSELIIEYKRIFPNLDYKQNQGQLSNNCNSFFQYLKKAQKQLKLMGNQMSNIVAARNSFMENLNNCNLNMLPEYERNVYSQYLGESKRQPVLLFVHDHKVQDQIRNFRDHTVGKLNPFQHFNDMLIFQSREVESFQQTILAKQNLEKNKKSLQQKCLSYQAQVAKLIGGKTTFKSIFSKGSKSQQIQILQKQIPQLQKEIQATTQLCEMINVILNTQEIPKFKSTKQKQYYQLLSVTSDQQLTYLAAYGAYMKSVMQGLTKTVIKI